MICLSVKAGSNYNDPTRTVSFAISRRDFQSTQSPELQHSEPDHLYIIDLRYQDLWYGRGNYEHVYYVATGSVWPEIDLVAELKMRDFGFAARDTQIHCAGTKISIAAGCESCGDNKRTLRRQ
jgi:hypothetical protein